MPSRIVRDGILTSAAVNALSPLAELFYRRLFSVVDDHGRYFGHPSILRAGAFPMQIDRITDADVEGWLNECCSGNEPLIRKYDVNGTTYIAINKFGQRVRSDASKYPAPPKTVEGNPADNPPRIGGQPAVNPPSIDGDAQDCSADNPPLARAESESESESYAETEAKSEAGPPTPPPLLTPTALDSETFSEFEQAYREAKPDVIPEDFADALIPWRQLAFNQKLIAVSGIRRRLEFGRWRPDEPHFIPPPSKYLRSGEWKREVYPPPAAKKSPRELAVERMMREAEEADACN